MTERSSKIITILFLFIIFLFGITTILKCTDMVEQVIQEKKILANKDIIEAEIKDNFKSRNNWINLNGLFQRMIGVTIVRDPADTDVYRLKNGQLMYNLPERDMHVYADEVEDLYSFTKELDKDFLYVQLPYKIESSDVMPPGTAAYGNSNADQLIDLLSDKKIPKLDIREHIYKEDLEWETLFFDTDHHWKPSTALWAAGLISEKIEKEYGKNVDEACYNIDNYNVETREDWFLGSLGKRTGVFYGGVDDFDVITPKFETSFEFWGISPLGNEVERDGSFEEALLNQETINDKDWFNVNSHSGYTGGNFRVNIIENLNPPNDMDILLIRESFSNTMMPFLSLSAKSLTAIDMREYKESSITEYLEEHEYIDLVIVAYNPSAFSREQFEFSGK